MTALKAKDWNATFLAKGLSVKIGQLIDQTNEQNEKKKKSNIIASSPMEISSNRVKGNTFTHFSSKVKIMFIRK